MGGWHSSFPCHSYHGARNPMLGRHKGPTASKGVHWEGRRWGLQEQLGIQQRPRDRATWCRTLQETIPTFPLLRPQGRRNQRSQLYRLRPKYLEAVQEQRPFLLRRLDQGRPRGPLLLHQGEEGSFIRVHLSLSLGGDKDDDDGQLDDNRNSSNFRDILVLVEP